MRIVIYVIMLLMIANAAYALDSSIGIELLPSGAAIEIIKTEFVAQEDASKVSYSLLNEPQNLKVYQNGEEIGYEIIRNEFYEIVIDKKVNKGQAYSLNLEFDIKGLVEQSGKQYVFSFRYQPAANVENFNLDLRLPRGFSLADIESAVSPAGYKASSDGKNIIISWKLKDVDDEQSFIVVYERGMAGNSSYLWIFGLLAVALFAIFGIVLFYRREKREIVSGVLSQDEKKIMAIIESGNDITQKQVVKDTGFSKAKVSKIIRRLEEMGIVEKKPWMATNKLKIKNKIKR